MRKWSSETVTESDNYTSSQNLLRKINLRDKIGDFKDNCKANEDSLTKEEIMMINSTSNKLDG